jgi:bifunctional DNA-binding transcriptional regulator/antitoxin component of YhaV-PrlF toxin-antitoxin module
MTAEQVVTVQITPDGMLPIPEALRRELGLESAQTVQLTPQDNGLIVRPLSQQEIGDRIVMMLKKALAGLTWEDIQAERSSDDFWR